MPICDRVLLNVYTTTHSISETSHHPLWHHYGSDRSDPPTFWGWQEYLAWQSSFQVDSGNYRQDKKVAKLFLGRALSVREQTTLWTASLPMWCILKFYKLMKFETQYNISMSEHVGTHIDAPFHFNPKGWTTDAIPLEVDFHIVKCEMLMSRYSIQATVKISMSQYVQQQIEQLSSSSQSICLDTSFYLWCAIEWTLVHLYFLRFSQSHCNNFTTHCIA